MVQNSRQRIESYMSPGFPYVDMFVEFSADGEVNQLQIPIMGNYLKEFSEKRIQNQNGIIKISLFDPSFTDLESLLLVNRNNLRFKFGWTYGGQEGESTLVETQLIDYQTKFTWQGIEINLKLMETSVPDDSVFTRRWPQFTENPQAANEFSLTSPEAKANGVKISTIVRRIAEEMGYTGTLEEDIEETEGFINTWQNGVANLPFVSEYLTTLAKSQKRGTFDYEFYIQNRRLLFRTPDYNKSVSRRYIYARDQQSELIEFAPKFKGYVGTQGAVNSPIAVSWDPLSKKEIRVEASYRDNLKERVGLARTRPPVGGKRQGSGGVVYNFPFDDFKMTEAQLKGHFDSGAKSVVEAEATVLGDPLIEPLDIIEVVVLLPNGDLHYFSGNYLVLDVENVITAGSYITKLRLVSDGSRSLEALNDNTIKKDPSNAPEDRDRNTNKSTVESRPL
jgi:hypothetical protein